ncbi:ATP-dependent protease La (LON) domain protein [compost metagenome]
MASLDMGGLPSGAQALANRLAYLLPFSRAQKLNLLECDDAGERLARLTTWLEALQREA